MKLLSDTDTENESGGHGLACIFYPIINVLLLYIMDVGKQCRPRAECGV